MSGDDGWYPMFIFIFCGFVITILALGEITAKLDAILVTLHTEVRK